MPLKCCNNLGVSSASIICASLLNTIRVNTRLERIKYKLVIRWTERAQTAFWHIYVLHKYVGLKYAGCLESQEPITEIAPTLDHYSRHQERIKCREYHHLVDATVITPKTIHSSLEFFNIYALPPGEH